MKITIIIPVINEVEVIRAAISRAWDTGCDEVIVADGGSTDGTIDAVKQMNGCLVNSPPGRGLQLNSGAEVVTGDVLLFLHADNWLARESCQQIRSAVDGTGPIWGGFYQRIEDPAIKYRWLERGNAWRARWQGLVYGDQAMFVSRTLFESIRGFPDIPLMEDFEISCRLSKVQRPTILSGPVHVSVRRWQQAGVLRQTIKNWWLASAYRLGVSPEKLKNSYRRHDQH